VVGICNFGAAITKFIVTDKNGQSKDVILGFQDLEEYKNNPCFLGVTVGRYANRIANATFILDDIKYNLEANNATNSLHGGNNGFHHKMWNVESLTYTSSHLEEGFPGNLFVSVQFELTDLNEIIISYEAKTDKTTVINLTNHAYFNLNGEGSGSCINHTLQINAQYITTINSSGIPNGQLMDVENTPFDFRQSKTIGKDINNPNEQLQFGKGYDHNFVLNSLDTSLHLAAVAIGDLSGIKLEVLTTEPGLQLYTGNFLTDSAIGKSGKPNTYRQGFCLETQHFPDSPNQLQFPSTVLKAGDTFKSATVYKLSI
jgi:aldose 1-epimerase